MFLIQFIPGFRRVTNFYLVCHWQIRKTFSWTTVSIGRPLRNLFPRKTLYIGLRKLCIGHYYQSLNGGSAKTVTVFVQTFELRTLKFGLYYPLMIYCPNFRTTNFKVWTVLSTDDILYTTTIYIRSVLFRT